MQENKQEKQEWRILHGKLTNDGGHNIFQADPPRRYAKRKRRAYIDKIVEADVSAFEKVKQEVEDPVAEKKKCRCVRYSINFTKSGKPSRRKDVGNY